VPGRDQLERLVGERQRVALLRLVHLDAAWPQHLTGALRIGRPCLGDAHPLRQHSRLGDHLAATGVDVQRGRDPCQPVGEQARVAPRWTLLRGTTVEPREAPTGDVGGLGLGDEIIERHHGPILSAARPVREDRARSEGRSEGVPGEARKARGLAGTDGVHTIES
jgi:hypothetical protein